MGRVDPLGSGPDPQKQGQWVIGADPKFQNGSIGPEPIGLMGIMARPTYHINDFFI